jgi:hypothetical protein
VKKGLLLLAFLALTATTFLAKCGKVADTSQLSRGSVMLTWNAPTKNVDGTTLTDLAGYRIHYGKASGSMTDTISLGTSTSVIIDDLELDTNYYLAVTAIDHLGNESMLSSEVSAFMAGN